MELTGERALLKAAQNGDVRTLEQLIERHRDRVYRFGMKMCHHPEDAEDVLQDTLLTMARSIRAYRGDSSLSTWLYTIARSFCIKKRSRSKFAPCFDPERKLRATICYPLNVGRNFDELLRVVDALQTVDRYDVACPADWTPGERVIVSLPATTQDADRRIHNRKYDITDWYFARRNL